MERRQFLITTFGLTSASVLSSCGNPENKLIPVLIPHDEWIPGIDYWKATSCAMCSAGCGILVRTRDMKANKIEGNPAHPANRGGLCARGQAGLQVLYNTDRVRTPLKLAGARGSGQFQEISWDEAIKALTDKLKELQAQTDTAVLFATSEPWGVTRYAATRLKGSLPQCQIVTEDVRGQLTQRAYAQVYGRTGRPIFDIGNARFVLSFGARFLETWHSPTMYSHAYGEFRRGEGRPRGKFVQIEPRLSLTGANADEWLPARPGSERLVALGIAQVIIREGLIKNVAAPQGLDDYAPEKTAQQTDVPAEKIIKIAHEFAASQPAVAIADDAVDSQDTAVQAREIARIEAIQFLNSLAGNLNKRGGVLVTGKASQAAPERNTPASRPAAVPDFDPLLQLREPERNFGELMPLEAILSQSGKIGALLTHHINPAHTSPAILEKLKAIPFIVSFSSLKDETTQLADLVLPDHSYLENWDLRASEVAEADESGKVSRTYAVRLSQPVLAPEYSTRQTADVLLAVSNELGGSENQSALKTAEEIVKQAAGQLQKQKGSIEAATPDDFWKTLVERGVWVGEVAEAVPSVAEARPRSIILEPSQAADAAGGQFPLTLLAYEHNALGIGETANIPWLQEMPDPMTSVIWGSWVEINPRTAASLGVADGDLVEIKSTQGAVQAPAVIYPAIRPDVVAMPLGQGHTQGLFAANRGVNAALLLTSNRGPGMTPVSISKAPGAVELVRFGTMLPEEVPAKRQ